MTMVIPAFKRLFLPGKNLIKIFQHDGTAGT
jgi:hypothetical protein